MITSNIQSRIFEIAPTFHRRQIHVSKMNNRGESAELTDWLRDAVTRAGSEPLDLSSDSRITVWNDAHRLFGSNPNRFMPAHFALRKRVQKAGSQLPFINKAVTIMNLNSINHVLPVGGDDLLYAGCQLELQLAKGDEKFIPLGEPENVESPEAGEVIYFAKDIGEVMCRRWNWRNGHTTRITEETTTMLINVDGLGEGSEARTIAARDQVAEMLRRFCDAQLTTALLSPSNPTCNFSVGDVGK